MTLIERIEADFLQAFKGKEEATVSVLRMLKSALKNKEIDLMKPLTDEQAIQVIKGEVKKRKESIESFKQGGRPELADKEAAELKILEVYLPQALTQEQINAKVSAAIAELPEGDRSDFGKVMKASMTALKGSADGQAVSQAVKESLAKK
jgi:uncharacterized protein